jgi:hypothetical protein
VKHSFLGEYASLPHGAADKPAAPWGAFLQTTIENLNQGFALRRCIIRRTGITAAVTVAALAFFLPPAAAVTLPSNLKIMPLGDSITYGLNGTDAGYRGWLYTLLSTVQPGYQSPVAPGVQFVGIKTLNPGSLPVDQQHHNGLQSYKSLDINNNLDGLDTTRYNVYGYGSTNPDGGYWLTGGHGTNRNALFPDVVLLMVGTNDTLQECQNNYPTLVNHIVTLRPNARLILANITPNGDKNRPAATAINNVVNTVAQQYSGPQYHVSVVDLYTGFPSNGLSSDNVHPNDTGFTWMADQWYGAIVKSYHAPEPNTVVLLLTGSLTTAVCAWCKRRSGCVESQ